MPAIDTRCSLVPCFKVAEGQLPAFRSLCERCVEMTLAEPKCMYCGFTFNGDRVHCREGYADAAGVPAHRDNVGALLQEALKIAEITCLEVRGPAAVLDKLRGPMGALHPRFFTLEYGFRN